MNKPFGLIFLIALLFVACEKGEDHSSPTYLRYYYPAGQTQQIIAHTYYSLSYSEADEQAEWVAYLLTSAMPSSVVERTNDFRADPSVTTGSSELSDYLGSGYDRGHLCPAEDMSFSRVAMSETFFLSNISPQDPDFNRGIWSCLEAQVRDWAVKYDSLYIVTGPVLSSNKGTIGANKVSVPGYYYKVILDYCQPDVKMIAFIIPNKKISGTLAGYAVSSDSVEIVTGIDFFPLLPDNIENTLESQCDSLCWDFSKSALWPI